MALIEAEIIGLFQIVSKASSAMAPLVIPVH